LKFGVPIHEVSDLVQKARELNMSVVGVSFHVGSGCFDSSAYTEAISVARQVFDIAATHGYKMTLLDIGGGFPGDISAPLSFDKIAPVVNQALDTYFPNDPELRCIAEPGRYYVSSSGTLAVNVISKRKVKTQNEATQV
jgi:ornithine decarboxylase